MKDARCRRVGPWADSQPLQAPVDGMHMCVGSVQVAGSIVDFMARASQSDGRKAVASDTRDPKAHASKPMLVLLHFP